MVRIASKATKGKGKRWQKGSSSTCNPESRKHRSRVSEALLGASSNVTSSNQNFKLTKDFLEKFDAIQLQKLKLQNNVQSDEPTASGIDQWLNVQRNRIENDEMLERAETRSIGATSAASVWTNCTNISFDRFLTGFDAKSTIHKAMLTVLATIREAIELEKGSETETEYFAGLMLALNCVDSEEKLTATISLIQMVLPKVPTTVLKKKYVETAQILLKILCDRIDSSNAYLIKVIIKTLATLMQEQDEPAWESTITSKIFQLLLELILHPKPRVRKAAQFAVNAIINNKKQEPFMVARKILAQFCITKLEKHLKTSQDQHLQTLLYISTIMSQTFHRFPDVASTKKAAEAILSHMTFGNVLVINGALKTFYYFFMDKPCKEVLSPELNAQLLNALYDYQPNINDEQPLNAWLLAMSQGLISLHSLDRKLSHSHLLKFIKTCVLCFGSDNRNVQATSANTIQLLFNEIAVQEEFNHDKRMRFFEEIENSLKYQYSNSWLRVIPMISQLQLIDGQQYFFSIWQRLAILHEPKESELNSAIDHCIGQAVKFYGPNAVLKQIPITWQASECEMTMDQFDAEIRGEFTNAWLMPILRDFTFQQGQIGLFVDHFLPIAEDLLKKSKNFAKMSNNLRQQMNQSMETEYDSKDSLFKAHETLLVTSKELKRCVHASWALLPSFCRSPIDAPTAFGRIAKKLGDTFYDKEFMIYASNALKNLLATGNNEVLNILAKFSKNYLPILFNVYTNEQNNIEDGHRGQILMIIQKFIHLLFREEDQTKLFRTFYEKIKERLNEPNCSDFRRKALLDLLNAFLSSPKGLKREDIDELYNNVAVPLILNGNIAFDQKKGFKIIEQIILSESPDTQGFINDNIEKCLEFLHELLTASGTKKAFTSPSTTAFAMRTLKQLVSKLHGDSEMFKRLFETFLPVIFKTFNLRSSKAVKNAQELLLTIFDSAEVKPEDSHELLMTILQPLREEKLNLNERTSRIVCINFLYTTRYHQKSTELQCSIADVILQQMICSKDDTGITRDILDVCFDFITMFLKNSKEETFTLYLENIITALTNLPESQRMKYRMKIKILLTKLGRKFGFDMISKVVSDDYKKVLKNIRKLETAKKKKSSKDENNSSDHENNIDDDRKSRLSRRSRRFMDSSDEDEAKFINEEWNNNQVDDDNLKTDKSKKFDIMSRISTKTTKSFFKEDTDGDPIDLLSSNASKQIFSKIPKQFSSKDHLEEKDESASSLAKKLPIAEDGRINMGQLFNQIEKTDKYTEGKLKRSLENNYDSEDDDEDSDNDDDQDKKGKITVNSDTHSRKSCSTYKPGGRGIHRKTRPIRRRKIG